jgi:hypothetical protein
MADQYAMSIGLKILRYGVKKHRALTCGDGGVADAVMLTKFGPGLLRGPWKVRCALLGLSVFSSLSLIWSLSFYSLQVADG